MKKNIFYGIIAILFLILLVSIQSYNKQKNIVYNKDRLFNSFKQKIEKIKYLKQYYKNNNITQLSKYCQIQKTDKYVINCQKLNETKFKKVEKLFFNPHNKIINYDIQLNKNLITLKGVISK